MERKIELKRVNVVSVFKFMLVIGMILGLLFGLGAGLVGGFGISRMSFGTCVGIGVVWGILSAVVWGICAAIYNLIAGLIGGIKMTLHQPTGVEDDA